MAIKILKVEIYVALEEGVTVTSKGYIFMPRDLLYCRSAVDLSCSKSYSKATVNSFFLFVAQCSSSDMQ